MKQSLLLALVFLLIGTAGNAQNPPVGYIGLFSNDQHADWCAEGATVFYPVEMWVWCLPSVNGQIGVQFEIGYPYNVAQSTLTWNEELIGAIPAIAPEEGVDVAYTSCQWDWHWVLHQLIYVTDLVPTYCEIIPHPDSGEYQFYNCQDGYPLEPCIKFTNLYLNYDAESPECAGTATRDASWGAIKHLMQ